MMMILQNNKSKIQNLKGGNTTYKSHRIRHVGCSKQKIWPHRMAYMCRYLVYLYTHSVSVIKKNSSIIQMIIEINSTRIFLAINPSSVPTFCGILLACSGNYHLGKHLQNINSYCHQTCIRAMNCKERQQYGEGSLWNYFVNL